MDEYLYRRSGGMIGSLSQLIRGAAILAIEDGREQITRDLLDIVPVDYAAERADTTRATQKCAARRPAGRGLMRPPRLPIPVPPARHETLASYLTRLAALHGLHPRELWEPVSTPQPGTTRRTRAGRPARRGHRPPAVSSSLGHCPSCATRRRTGPPGDTSRNPAAPAATPATTAARCSDCCRSTATSAPGTGTGSDHRTPANPPPRSTTRTSRTSSPRSAGTPRLLRRHGAAVTFDAVLTGFLICGHIWADRLDDWSAATSRWTHRSHTLIPVGLETDTFSAARIFAAIYPETVDLAQLIASPAWRSLAAGDADQQQRFVNELGRRLGRPDYQPPQNGDAIAHWMKYDSWRAPSRPHTTFPDTRQHRSGPPATTSTQSLERHHAERTGSP